MASWPQIEDIAGSQKRVEEQIQDIPLPAVVSLKGIDVTDDFTGDPAFYIDYSLSRKPSRQLGPEKNRELTAPAHTVSERVFAMRAGRFPHVHDIAAFYSRWDRLFFSDEAGLAFTARQSIRRSDEANVFLAALLFGSRWAK